MKRDNPFLVWTSASERTNQPGDRKKPSFLMRLCFWALPVLALWNAADSLYRYHKGQMSFWSLFFSIAGPTGMALLAWREYFPAKRDGADDPA